MSDEDDIDETHEAPLPLRWTRFVDAFAGESNGNATRACRMAGYHGDENTLASRASRLLRNPRIRGAIEARINGDHLAASRLERIRFLSAVMRGQLTEKKYVGRDKDDKPIYEDCEPTLRERLAAEEALSKRSGEQVHKIAQTNSQGEDIRSLSLEQLLAMAGGDSRFVA